METKYCCGCEKDLPYDSFGVHKGRKYGLQVRCKSCKKDYDRKRYKEKSYLQKAASQKNREKIRDLFDDYKKTLVCSSCGDDRWYVLDFHHVNPEEKTAGISVMKNSSVSFESLMEEVDKCIPLCRNCHTELHYFERLKTSQGITNGKLKVS